jgi:hypothetical protein
VLPYPGGITWEIKDPLDEHLSYDKFYFLEPHSR